VTPLLRAISCFLVWIKHNFHDLHEFKCGFALASRQIVQRKSVSAISEDGQVRGREKNSLMYLLKEAENARPERKKDKGNELRST